MSVCCFWSSLHILHRVGSIAYFMWVSIQHRLVILVCHRCSIGCNSFLIFWLRVIRMVFRCVATGWTVECLVLLLINLQLSHDLGLLVPHLRILLSTLWFLLVDKRLHVLFDIFLQIVMRTGHLGHDTWFQGNRLLLAFDWRLYLLRIPYYC